MCLSETFDLVSCRESKGYIVNHRHVDDSVRESLRRCGPIQGIKLGIDAIPKVTKHERHVPDGKKSKPKGHTTPSMFRFVGFFRV